MALRHVDATKPAPRAVRVYSRLGRGRAARFVSRHLGWKLDPLLLRLTGGRVASTLIIRSAVLETTGIKTGRRRRCTVIYFHDGNGVVIAASNAGASAHPAWFYNLDAHHDVTLGGQAMRAAVVDDEAEATRLWQLADNVFPAFADYRREAAAAGRTIPLIRLTEHGVGP